MNWVVKAAALTAAGISALSGIMAVYGFAQTSLVNGTLTKPSPTSTPARPALRRRRLPPKGG